MFSKLLVSKVIHIEIHVPFSQNLHMLKQEKGGKGVLSTGAFIQAMIPLYIMAAIGFVNRKVNILPAQLNQVITQLMLYITLPALILFSLDGTFTVSVVKEFFWLVTMSIFILSIFIFVAAWLRRRATLAKGQKSVYESLIIFGNQGFIGFAIAYILMGKQGILYLTFFNICYLILIWTYGIYIFTKNTPGKHWRKLCFNPGILSTFLGIGMLLLPFQWPHFLLDTFESIGKMTIPLSMILIGSLLADIRWSDFRKYCTNRYIWVAASCKLLILPLFLLVFYIFDVPYAFMTIAVLTSAMPSASTISIYAQKYGADASFASFGVLLTTLLCVFTIPVLYGLLQWLYA